jgi:hypothetical protein
MFNEIHLLLREPHAISFCAIQIEIVMVRNNSFDSVEGLNILLQATT